MGVPIEKRLGNVQKALLTGMLDGGKSFDPNNPKDVKRRKELEKQVEALQSISSLVTDPTGGGLVGVAKGISKAGFAKMAKAKFTQNRAKQIIDLVTKPMTRGKKAVPKTTPTVKEVVEKKPTIPTTIPTSGSTASDKIKSLSNAEIKAFENVKNARELAEKQAKNVPTTTSNAPAVKELWKKPLPTPSYTNDGFRIGGTEAKSILSNLKDKEAARKAAKEAYEKSKATIIKQGIEESNRKIVDKAISIGAISGLLGGGTAATYYGMQLSNKDKKQTTTPQKTSPVDLKRIDKSKLKDSNIEGVKTIRGSDGKDYGIQWNNTTKSWDYYRGDKTKKTETPKPDLKREDVGGGYTPIKDNKGSGTESGGKTTTGGGTGTTPRSTTIPKTTAPIMGDEEYKKDPRLAILRQQDDDRQLLARAEAQKKEMKEFKPTESLDVLPVPTKPLSSLMFKTSSLNPKTNSRVEPVSYDTIDIVDTKSKKLRKKSYGGNLAMLKYMKQ